MRRRLWRSSMMKSISSSSLSSYSRGSLSLGGRACSTLGKTPWPSTAFADDAGELSPILSTLPKRGAFIRGVACVCAHISSPSSLPSSTPPSTRGVGRSGVPTTKRFAGATLRSSPFVARTDNFGFGVCAGESTVKPWRRLECGFGRGFCEGGCAGARKRCGEGVWEGIVTCASAALVQYEAEKEMGWGLVDMRATWRRGG
jgi:hypothetical protein